MQSKWKSKWELQCKRSKMPLQRPLLSTSRDLERRDSRSDKAKRNEETLTRKLMKEGFEAKTGNKKTGNRNTDNQEKERNMDARKIIGIIVASLVLALGLAACETENKEPDMGVTTEVGTGTQVPENMNPSDYIVRAKVDWPSADKIDQKARSYLSAENLKRVDSSPVPVILPSDPEMLKNELVMVYETGYGFSSNYKNIYVSIDAGLISYDFPWLRNLKLPPSTDGVRGTKVYIGADERGVTVSWNENNLLYDVLFNCGGPPDDYGCTKDFMLNTLNNAAYVGGRGKE